MAWGGKGHQDLTIMIFSANSDLRLLVLCLACVAVEDGGFFFALATAPAHVEDKLDDAWVEFARQTVPADNPAGDPPEVRTGEQPNAASVTGISLTEEAQAQEIKEGEEIKQMHWQSFFFGAHAVHGNGYDLEE